MLGIRLKIVVFSTLLYAKFITLFFMRRVVGADFQKKLSEKKIFKLFSNFFNIFFQRTLLHGFLPWYSSLVAPTYYEESYEILEVGD